MDVFIYLLGIIVAMPIGYAVIFRMMVAYEGHNPENVDRMLAGVGAFVFGFVWPVAALLFTIRSFYYLFRNTTGVDILALLEGRK